MPPALRPLRLADMGEFAFLKELLPNLATARDDIVLGVGDDAAVLDPGGQRIVVTTDSLVENVHFRAGWLSPRQLGRRAFLVNASDVAAMGARPRWCVVSIGTAGSIAARDLGRIMAGAQAAAAEHGCAIVGGNLSKSANLFLSVTVIGTLAGGAVTRSGARPGDLIYVSGRLGGAARVVARLLRGERLTSRAASLRPYAEPPARTVLGPRLAEQGLATAMIDVSDGLLQDLGHICDASGVGARLDLDAIPVAGVSHRRRFEALGFALRGGEDYELLFSVDPRSVEPILQLSRDLHCPLTRIGAFSSDRAVCDLRGEPLGAVEPALGYDHYREHRKPLRKSSKRRAADGSRSPA